MYENSEREREQDLYLAHYGVLGMKWGVRKKEPYSLIRESATRKSKAIGRTQKAIGKTQKSINRIQRRQQLLQDKKKSLERKTAAAIKNSELELKYRKQTSLGKQIAQNILFSSAGAETYRLARAKGKGRIGAAITPTSWYGEKKKI